MSGLYDRANWPEGYIPFQAMGQRDYYLQKEVEAFIARHGGIANAVNDLGGEIDGETLESVNKHVIFFGTGALLCRDKLSNEFIIMMDPPPEGSRELLDRQRVFYLSKTIQAASQFYLLRSQLLDTGDADNVESLRIAADIVKIRQASLRAIDKQISELPDEVEKRKRIARTTELKERNQQEEAERRHRVNAAIREITIDDGEPGIPDVQRAERAAAHAGTQRQRLREWYAQYAQQTSPAELASPELERTL